MVCLLFFITSYILLISYYSWYSLLLRYLILLALDNFNRFFNGNKLFFQAIQSLIEFVVLVDLLLSNFTLSFYFFFMFFPLLDYGHLQRLLYRRVIVVDFMRKLRDQLLQCLYFCLIHLCELLEISLDCGIALSKHLEQFKH